jgi:AraC-like DNA-binding protein
MRTLPICQAIEQAPVWHAALSLPPRIEALAIGHHGKEPVEDYRLPDLWCLHLYRYEGVLRVKDISLPLRPGTISFVPPNTPLSHFFGPPQMPSVHLYAHFRLPSSLPRPEGIDDVLLPALQDAHPDFERLWLQMENAMGAWASGRPHRAEAALWDLLWQAVERAERACIGDRAGSGAGEPQVIQRARDIIEHRLGEPLRVTEIADAVGLSHNHLTRLFRAATGQSVIAYLRERRVLRARHLLVHSTLPIKAIARQVGLPDPHQFNKTIRRVTGSAPRDLRKAVPNGVS